MTVAKRVHGYDSEEEEEITKTTPSPPLNLYNMSQSTLSRHFAAPKSQKLRNMRSSHYAAVSRKPFDAFSLMKESEPVEDFEEAGFLRPVGDVMDVE